MSNSQISLASMIVLAPALGLLVVGFMSPTAPHLTAAAFQLVFFWQVTTAIRELNQPLSYERRRRVWLRLSIFLCATVGFFGFWR